MSRVIVTNPFCGIYGMQVCAVKDATDDEILEVCNRENPSGTTAGWGRVVRTLQNDEPEKILPIQCADMPERMHFLVFC